MPEEDILEGNKLLAEFVGIQVTDFHWGDWKTLIIGDEDDAIDFGELQYYTPDKDWNQLMDIVEKIESIKDPHQGNFPVYIYSNSCSIQGSNLYRALENSNYSGVYISNPDAIFDTKIKSTWYNVVQFIKWYKGNNNG